MFATLGPPGQRAQARADHRHGGRQPLSEGGYLARHNARFMVEPELETSGFTPLVGSYIANILCIQDERIVGADNTLRSEPEAPDPAQCVAAPLREGARPGASIYRRHPRAVSGAPCDRELPRRWPADAGGAKTSRLSGRRDRGPATPAPAPSTRSAKRNRTDHCSTIRTCSFALDTRSRPSLAPSSRTS